MKHQNQTGFTILELLIATAVFSIILLIGATTIIQVGRMYYRGVVASKNREVVRNVIDEISRPIQLEGAGVITGVAPENQPSTGEQVSVEVFCIGSKRYTYTTGAFLDETLDGTVVAGLNNTKRVRHVLWVDNGGSVCTPANLTIPNPTPDGTELLSPGMMLSDMSLTSTSIGATGTQRSYNLRVFGLTGADDLVQSDGSVWRCGAEIVGSQWCAGSDLFTNVYKRIE
ncbi:prepilin-type N-terminal cleavage/methylation domain-containing protein [Candidatus Saccharibacteria bacterium]|nr:prepilin-type N-terminal cleavage/methylation domain-containing protein [Candidatus Saccharibacteria bacterium]